MANQITGRPKTKDVLSLEVWILHRFYPLCMPSSSVIQSNRYEALLNIDLVPYGLREEG